MHAIGTVYISNDLELRNALYIPSFSMNLPSVPALLQHTDYHVVFYTDHLVIQDLYSKVIAKGSLVKGLFILQPSVSLLSDHSTLSSPFIHDFPVNHVSVHKWHHRLGHLSDNVLHKLSNVLFLINPFLEFLIVMCAP